MNKSDIEFTKQWWQRTVANEEKLILWLQKLQRTELSGYTDHIEYMANHSVTERERKILTNIAEDELKHSDLFIDLFKDRKIEVVPDGEQSGYWDDVLSKVTNMSEYCSANYFGEALASYRFEIILGMEETPSDIRYVIDRALPDEIFHRETLMRLAGEETIERFRKHHADAYFKLTGRPA